jgi:transcriptional regulator with XRE-family HTH domain
MKKEEKEIAIELRSKGLSMNEIVTKLGVSKSSISLWVRDVQLTAKQKEGLSLRGVRKEAIEKRRETRLRNENARRQIIIDAAKKELKNISSNDLRKIGTALYWAEGAKTKRSVVQFSNSDPEMIKLMMKFFRNICCVPKEKFRGHIHIHPHLDAKRAENHWAKISDIPSSQFYKTYQKPNKSSKNLKDSLPFGTFDIYVCDTALFLKIKGWTEKITELVLHKMR